MASAELLSISNISLGRCRKGDLAKVSCSRPGSGCNAMLKALTLLVVRNMTMSKFADKPRGPSFKLSGGMEVPAELASPLQVRHVYLFDEKMEPSLGGK